ncbi:hypothetical protein BC939DRAFT_481599 [Gamsiella multidivaricata]|uniref:uncharacterized protein n=1 Tax=Gamsiella multidivaricata TaxID=101098 RepID=UPI00221F9188|nr:uncharacterized protein BC939DRAFT_481599 [Gamsiella multidivaricata]KAI7816929.1 hypothetical protein BC939DRAFT_481599 [Gamsiella multidivaricata]
MWEPGDVQLYQHDHDRVSANKPGSEDILTRRDKFQYNSQEKHGFFKTHIEAWNPEMFGGPTKAKLKTQSHLGELFRKLFFHGMEANHDRHACVEFPDDKSLLRLVYLDSLLCQNELDIPTTQLVDTPEHKRAKEDVKTALKKSILAIDNATRARNARRRKKEDEDKDNSKEASQSGASCSTKQPKVKKNDQQDITGASMASAMPMRSMVKYLTEAIPGPEALQKEFDNQESHVVLAIDPSIKNTAAAVIVDSLIPEMSWNLSLPKGCHTWNSRRYTRLLRCLRNKK